MELQGSHSVSLAVASLESCASISSFGFPIHCCCQQEFELITQHSIAHYKPWSPSPSPSRASPVRPDCSRRNAFTQSMAEYFLGRCNPCFHWSCVLVSNKTDGFNRFSLTCFAKTYFRNSMCTCSLGIHIICIRMFIHLHMNVIWYIRILTFAEPAIRITIFSVLLC